MKRYYGIILDGELIMSWSTQDIGQSRKNALHFAEQYKQAGKNAFPVLISEVK